MAKFHKSELTVSCDSNAARRNYLGVIVSVLVLTIISSLIVAAIVIINPEITSLPGRGFASREAITLDEALMGELSANNFAYQWLPTLETPARGEQEAADVLLFEESKNLNSISLPSEPTIDSDFDTSGARFKTGAITLVANSSLLASIEFKGYKISPSRRYLLIWTTKSKQFRHSFTAKYFLYDIKLDLISMLSTRPATGSSDGETSTDESVELGANLHHAYEHLDSASLYLNDVDEGDKHSRFQRVDWFSSGNGTRDSLVMVQDNDIYLLPDVAGDRQAASSKIQRATPLKLTFTGKTNEIFNGVPDWLYEEEILADVPALLVSPDANALAYLSFNDSQVELMPFSVYGSSERVLPSTQQIRYPKVGRVNPQVSVHIVDELMSDQRRPVQLRLPGTLSQRQHYINRINWLSSDRLAVIWLNRNQNESHFVICSRQSDWKCEQNLELRSPGGWLELTDDLLPLDEHHYLALLFKDEGPDVGFFKHVAKVSMAERNSYTFLTSGRREVTQINSLDRKRGLLYYTSTIENEPGQRQLFVVSLADGESTNRTDTCVTCSHYPEECLYNYAKLSPSNDYYIFECEGPGVPRTELRYTSARINSNNLLRQSKRQLQQIFDVTQKADKSESPLKRIITDSNATYTFAESNSDMNNNLPLANREGLSSANSSHQEKNQHRDVTLLWTIDNNQALRDKLTFTKAMPLTMRLKVPIASTNYSANVIMFLPPQMGAVNTLRATPQASASGRALPPRMSFQVRSSGAPLEQASHAYFTRDSIGEYIRQLPSGEQYPMVVDVYGGPNSQRVDYRFHIGYGHYLASTRRTVYAMIDGRGSGFQGTKRLYEMYHRFGTVEIQDQIDVSDYLAGNFSFIDASKVAIWGWSYGGYASAMALAQSNLRASHNFRAQLKQLNLSSFTSENDRNHKDGLHLLSRSLPKLSMKGVFECAVSVAPVTNWIYYDTAYTERYMSSPYANELYDTSSPGDHLSGQNRSPLVSAPTHSHVDPRSALWLPLNRTIDAYLRSPLARLASNSSAASSASSGYLNDRYMKASLLEHIQNIDKKRYLLIHGTADDNVHFQQSIMLMKRLVQNNILYETRLYPDQDHSISNKADKLHLYSTLSNFFAECFDMVC